MIEVVTYYSANAKPNEVWLAYVVLPDGNQWLVRFTGQTEAIAREKAVQLYAAERTKFEARINAEEDVIVDVSKHQDGRGHHFAGKAWLIHKITRVKIRVPMAEVEQYLGEYERGGPRSK